MANGNSERDELLAELLVQFEQQLASGTVAAPIDTSAIANDFELLAEWEADRSCLQILDRVRRHWAPGDASCYTPGPHQSLVSTVGGGSNTSLGRFRIIRELGRGGLGIVYLAYDPKLGRQVALKVPRAESLVSGDLRRRFLREAEAAARLNHPCLVSVYECDEEQAICFIVAEFCPGPSLAEWLKDRQGLVPLRVAARMVQQLAEAVQHAHAHGVLHRDIKPSNVLLSKPISTEQGPQSDAESLCPKLTDFGMAKLLEHQAEETRSGALVGTPAYMAPEQAQGRVHDLDSRTDVYGLGAILYECLTGQRVFNTHSDVEALRRVLFEEPQSPRRLRPEIPRDLEAICLKCLDKPPALRYQTAQHLAEDLGRFLAGEPTQARPTNAAGQLWKWARRRPTMAALASVVVLSAVSLFGIVLAYNSRLSAEISRTAAESLANRRLLYSANVRLAYETYQSNDVVQAQHLLDSQIPQPGQEDLREFAWHYLHEQCNPRTLKLVGHEGDVFSVAYSADGKLIATASKDGTARLWDAQTGAQRHVLRGHTGEVTCVAFSHNGVTLATGSEDSTVKFWDVSTGREGGTLRGHIDHVLAVAYSPDGQYLVSGGRDHAVRIWDLASGQSLRGFENRMDVVRAIAFSPSGDKLFVADELAQLHVWRTTDWRRLLRQRLSNEKFCSLAVSRDGELVAVAGQHRTIWRWAIEGNNLRELPPRDTGHTDVILSLAFSPTDDTLASAGRDSTVQLSSLGSTDTARALRGHTGRAASVAWSPDGQHLASASGDRVVRIWNLATSASRQYAMIGPTAANPTFSRDGNVLLTGADAGEVHTWDPITRTLAKQFAVPDKRVQAIAFAPDGSLFATRSADGPISVLSTKTYAGLLQLSHPKLRDADAVLDWLPTGRAIALTSDPNTVVIFDVDSHAVTHTFKHPGMVRSVRCTRDGYLVVATIQSLDIWDLRTKQRVHSLPEPFSDVAVSNAGTLIAASDRKNKVTFIEPQNGFAVDRIVTGGTANYLAFSPDGRTLAVGADRPATISLWDTRTRQELMKLECNFRLLSGLVFSPDGNRLVATGRNAVDSEENGYISEWMIRSGH